MGRVDNTRVNEGARGARGDHDVNEQADRGSPATAREAAECTLAHKGQGRKNEEDRKIEEGA